MRSLFTIFLSCAIASAGFAQATPRQPQQPQPQAEFPKASQYNHAKWSYKLIPALNQTWGYDIYADGKLLIHQPGVPGLPGNNGFKTKAGAEKVAALVIAKIKKGEMPPTVEIQEMKKLKAI